MGPSPLPALEVLDQTLQPFDGVLGDPKNEVALPTQKTSDARSAGTSLGVTARVVVINMAQGLATGA